MNQSTSSAVLACIVIACASVAQGATAHLTLQSPPGEWIGGGQNHDLTYGEAGDLVSALVFGTTGGLPDYLLFTLNKNGPPNTYATLQFATEQLGTALLPGTYNNAERAPFASLGHPGLDVTFQNRGSNTLYGSFTVTELDFTGNVLQRFSAFFEQRSGSPTAPALTGTFSYVLPEPAAALTVAAGAVLCTTRRRRGSKQIGRCAPGCGFRASD